MFEVYISGGMIDILLAETLRRVELSDTPAEKRAEASNAWFQIWGMRKLVDAAALITTTLDQQRRQQDADDHVAVKKILNDALTKVGQMFEALDGEADAWRQLRKGT